jgi:hypothetical protein
MCREFCWEMVTRRTGEKMFEKKINMNFRCIESWMDQAQDGVQCWASILAVLNFLVPLSDS